MLCPFGTKLDLRLPVQVHIFLFTQGKIKAFMVMKEANVFIMVAGR
jgi:hypothetical protein